MLHLNFKYTKTALKDILATPGRSFLTILGIVIGISSVIFMVNIGMSSKQAIANSIAGLTSDAIYIMPGKKQKNNTAMLMTFFNKFSITDIKRLQKINDFSFVKYGAGQSVSTMKVVYLSKSVDAPTWVITYGFLKSINHDLLYGREFTRRDFSVRNRVVILGNNLAINLFKQPDLAIGKNIIINGYNFTVIGVVSRESTLSGIGTFNESVIIPYDTASKLWYIGGFQVFIVKLRDISKVSILKNYLPRILTTDYHIQTQQDFLKQSSSIFNILTIFISLIAGVSLIVGNIGVMNIMLVSVKEKLREIGLRKAVGATDLDILVLFLVQSIVYNFIGAFLGVGLGIIASFLVTYLLKLPFSISILSIVVAVLLSFVSGIVSGIYPSLAAAKLSPSEALREE